MQVLHDYRVTDEMFIIVYCWLLNYIKEWQNKTKWLCTNICLNGSSVLYDTDTSERPTKSVEVVYEE